MITSEYDVLVVGAGLCGAVLARRIAEERNLRVLVIDRRNHLAGNMYDYANDAGIRVQAYGPHVFHTDDERAYEFVTRFCNPVPYKTKCEAVICDRATPSPFNFRTIDQFCGEDADALKQKLLSEFPGRSEVPVLEMLDSDDRDIALWAHFLFEEDYRPYTAKQWNIQPEDIDPSVLARVPIVLSYRDTYFDQKYEFIPEDGFSALADQMLGHPLIEVGLGCDALKHFDLLPEQHVIEAFGKRTPIVYTGPLDELFDFRYGELPYRSLKFDFKTFDTNSFQDAAITAYPKAVGYTRITEYTKMPIQHIEGKTTVAYEYPASVNGASWREAEPYYPVLTDDSKNAYSRYLRLADSFSNLYPCGRLADFRYYNMDQAVLRAFEVFECMGGSL